MKIKDAMDKYSELHSQVKSDESEIASMGEDIRLLIKARRTVALLLLLMGVEPEAAMAAQFAMGYKFGQFVAAQEKGVAELEKMHNL